MMVNGIPLTDGERHAYSKGHLRASLRFLKSNGSPFLEGVATPAAVRKHSRAWNARHGAAYEAAGVKGGTSAVKSVYTAQIKAAGVARNGENFGPRGRARDARLEKIAAIEAAAVARLTVLGLAPARSRKTPTAPASHGITAADLVDVVGGRVERVPVADIARESDGRIILAAVPTPTLPPETDTAVIPMTRAARKQSNRDLAEDMRAAGLDPRGDAWRRAVDGESLDSIAADLSRLSTDPTPAPVGAR